MKKVIRLTESDLVRIVKRVLKEDIEFDTKNPEFGKEYDDDDIEDVFYAQTTPNYGTQWYNKKDRETSDFDFPYDEEEHDDFDTFMKKFPYGKKQLGFHPGESGRKWFETFKRKQGGSIPIRIKRKSKD